MEMVQLKMVRPLFITAKKKKAYTISWEDTSKFIKIG